MLFSRDDLIGHTWAKLLDEDAFKFYVFCCVMVCLILGEVYLIVASIRVIATCLFESGCVLHFVCYDFAIYAAIYAAD
jgi:hypothetical protein